MSFKQASLFDFDEPPVEKKLQNKIELPENIAEEKIIINKEPVEIEFLQTTPLIEKTNTRGRKKISELEVTSTLLEVPDDDILFQKKYYGIGIVAEMFKVNISLIRFWEKEFDILKPKLNGKGDRHFRPEDIKNLKLIHHLLREKKYTIEGANDFLKKNKKSEEVFGVIENLTRTKLFLIDLKMSL
ncbi:MAG: MerR family transcriptional regulator [Ferruginibacter sp.]|nr:MerR family transcriptional regulator [Ferruginibacter sp.]